MILARPTPVVLDDQFHGRRVQCQPARLLRVGPTPRRPATRAVSDAGLAAEVEAIFDEHKGRYGGHSPTLKDFRGLHHRRHGDGLAFRLDKE